MCGDIFFIFQQSQPCKWLIIWNEKRNFSPANLIYHKSETFLEQLPPTFYFHNPIMFGLIKLFQSICLRQISGDKIKINRHDTIEITGWSIQIK